MPFAVVSGVAIALVDASPNWDGTGITAGALFMAAAVVTSVAGNKPWLWAILVGMWVPLLDISQTGEPAPLLALVFALAGALVGRAFSAMVRSQPGTLGR